MPVFINHDPPNNLVEPENPPRRGPIPIAWAGKTLSGVAPDIKRALAEYNRPPIIFQQDGRLVRVRRDDAGARIEPLTIDMVRHELDRAAVFQTHRRIGEATKVSAGPPPIDFVRDFMSWPEWPEEVIPTLASITCCPAFASDGSLMATAGYHPAARTWLELGRLEVDEVPENPTDDEVADARLLLLDSLLGDFPFAGDADKANALAFLLSPFVREFFRGPTPLGVADAPVQGTGKTLLIQALAYPALGHVVPTMPETKSEDERKKAITATLSTMTPWVLLDNLTGTLRSPSLSAALTTSSWTDRVLGETRMIRVPNRTVWTATANNVEVDTDLTRRVVWIRLDAKLERPDERPPSQFSHPNLLQWAETNRAKLVWAALVLVRAWLACKKPLGRQTMGSFEAWATTLGGILDVLGVPGFLSNAELRRRQVDDESNDFRTLCRRWWTEYADRAVGVKDLYDLVTELEIFPRVTSAETEKGGRQKLGHIFVKNRDRRFGPFQITLDDTDNSGRKLWRLKLVDGAAIPVDEPNFAAPQFNTMTLDEIINGPSQGDSWTYEPGADEDATVDSSDYGDIEDELVC